MTATAPSAPVSSARATSPDLIAAVVGRLRARFDSGATRSRRWRDQQLEGVERFVRECERDIFEALQADLAKPEIEAFAAEITFVANDAKHARKHLRDWMSSERVGTPLVAQPGKSEVIPEPLGVVLIIAPWNYPFQLLMAPLIGALAAGNCAVLKPSEITPHTSAMIAKLLPRYVDPASIEVIEGGVKETTALLKQRFDHIFYTGNGRVGRIVMRAAAEHLTPVTLELGGKSPAIVDATADLDVTAKRIVWGKFFNAGQTCVAPDYVLVEEAVHDALLTRMVAAVREFYGDDPQRSESYARIVNERHHDRLTQLLDSGVIACGGQHDRSDRYIAPTILTEVDARSSVMDDEIFGPILPVIAVHDLDEAIGFVNTRDKPLALYLFSDDAESQKRVLRRTSSGGVTLNHVWMHLAVPELPFGGVGASGMGAYHGPHSFDVFSHRKSVLRKSTKLDPAFLYPPYTDTKTTWLKRLL